MSRPARGACPSKGCKDHGIQARENIVPHGFFKCKAGKRRRYRCTSCGKEASAPTVKQHLMDDFS